MKYLEMQHISKSFPGVKALSDVTVCVDEGEVIALLGENGAGKSTLMNVLGGVINSDEGEIWIGGKRCSIKTVADASVVGISFIHQELSLFKQMSIEENMFVDRFPTNGPFIDRKMVRAETERILRELDVDLAPNTRISDLPVSLQQIVEIAAASFKQAKIIIFDEPTTSLAVHERAKLYEIIEKLRADKKVIIYITHDLDEALKLSDHVYVLRDGQNAGDMPSAGMTKDDIIRMMIGTKQGKQFFKTPREIADDVVLEVRDLHTREKLRGASLQLRRGEVLGLYGLVGAGRSELARALYGVDKLESGEVLVNGQVVKKPSPRAMKKRGIAFLTENRRDEGLFLELGLNHNITITDLDQLRAGPLKILNAKREYAISKEMIDKLKVATPGIYQQAGKLSGGNQQKIVIGKWMLVNPSIFILDEPTKGIDVGAKAEIYHLIDELSKEGVSVLLISSEIEEILGLSDRVVVMAKGKNVANLVGDHITKDEIIKYTMS